MYKVMEDIYLYRLHDYSNRYRRTSVDIDVNANLELVDKFCYLGNMLSTDEDADAAVENRIQIGTNKFRQLVPLLTKKDISLKVSGRLYLSLIHISEPTRPY